MSIVRTLKKLVDPLEAQKEQADLDDRQNPTLQKESGAPPNFVCRVCGHRDQVGEYCPNCLALTMERASDGD